MGDGMHSTAGKAMMRGLRRAIKDMPEADLRAYLTDMRDKLNVALESPAELIELEVEPIPVLADASHDFAAISTGR